MYDDLRLLATEFCGLTRERLETAATPSERAVALASAREYRYSQMRMGASAGNGGDSDGYAQHQWARSALRNIPRE